MPEYGCTVVLGDKDWLEARILSMDQRESLGEHSIWIYLIMGVGDDDDVHAMADC